MINNRCDLKEYIDTDLFYYKKMKNTRLKKVYSWFIKDNVQMVRRFIILLRTCEYYLNNSYKMTKKKSHFIYDLIYIVKKRQLNNLSLLLGLEIYENCFGKGLIIHHTGAIVVNPNAIIGDNCQIHGRVCIGNNGESGSGAPVIGNFVEIGVGAIIIGDITIASNTKIAAGAVVINSIYEEGYLWAGIPAQKIKKI